MAAPKSLLGGSSLDEFYLPDARGNRDASGDGARRQLAHRGLAVRILDADADLTHGLDEAATEEARAVALAEVLELRAGPCDLDYPKCSRPEFGLLVVRGLLTRKVEVAGCSCRELVGPGDVLRPWLDCGPQSPVPATAAWSALVPSSIGVLDRKFADAVRPWPQISAELMDRLLLRSRWIEFQLAVCQRRKVEDRVLLMLWQFAYRWGIVIPGGVALRIPLTHKQLAEVVGAERPTVTTALGRLKREGLIEQTRAGGPGWLLRGDPAAEIELLASSLRPRTREP
jgi:hypothetical protein